MIHKYKLMGMNIVLDVYSGAVHLVDDVFYELLDEVGDNFDKNGDYSAVLAKLSEKYPPKSVSDSYTELCALVKDGQLLSLIHI